jgi:hypothetical protein
MRVDMGFFASAMRYQTVLGERSDPHAVVSCLQCHGMMLEKNLVVHVSSHISGGVSDPTITLLINGDKKIVWVLE